MVNSERREQVEHRFLRVFQGERRDIAVFRAPGRVNLIGEHTDYNNGFVLPVAVDREVWIAARPRNDDEVRIRSANLKATATFSLSNLSKGSEVQWFSYPMGVATMLQEAGHSLRGMDVFVLGGIPVGAGMSSSAAFELATALAFVHLSRLEIDDLDLVKLCQKAENEFIGVSCGIMDQFVSYFARADLALFLDCQSLKHYYAPLPAQGVSIVVTDSGVRRNLASSEYNDRRSQCEEGVRLLAQSLPHVSSLRDVSPSDFEAHKHCLPDPIRKRCEHVIYENQRVLQTVRALSEGHLTELGELLYASHASLKDLYEVSCCELNVLVRLASEQEGVIGSRLTGAGFGGCTVSLVQEAAVEDFTARILERYRCKTGRKAKVHVCRSVDGAGRVE